MRITQGTFSFLPDFTDEQIEAQLRYALGNGWAIMVEHTDDPHPRNALWEMWSPPSISSATATGPSCWLAILSRRDRKSWASPILPAVKTTSGTPTNGFLTDQIKLNEEWRPVVGYANSGEVGSFGGSRHSKRARSPGLAIDRP